MTFRMLLFKYCCFTVICAAGFGLAVDGYRLTDQLTAGEEQMIKLAPASNPEPTIRTAKKIIALNDESRKCKVILGGIYLVGFCLATASFLIDIKKLKAKVS